MTLSPGEKLGPYEILSALGAGGTHYAVLRGRVGFLQVEYDLGVTALHQEMSPEMSLVIDAAVDVLKNVPNVAALVLGGSRARGLATSASDIDIGIYYRERLHCQYVSCVPRRNQSVLPAKYYRALEGPPASYASPWYRCGKFGRRQWRYRKACSSQPST